MGQIEGGECQNPISTLPANLNGCYFLPIRAFASLWCAFIIDKIYNVHYNKILLPDNMHSGAKSCFLKPSLKSPYTTPNPLLSLS